MNTMSSISYTNRCYICMKSLNDYLMLPYEEDYFGQEISIFKNTMIIKNIDPFTFLYFTCCNKCIDNYIVYKQKKNILSYLCKRELSNNNKYN